MVYAKRMWQIWLRAARFLGDQIGRVILTIFYFTIFMPFALIIRFWVDPLAMGPSHRAKWLERRTHDLTIKDAGRLY